MTAARAAPRRLAVAAPAGKRRQQPSSCCTVLCSHPKGCGDAPVQAQGAALVQQHPGGLQVVQDQGGDQTLRRCQGVPEGFCSFLVPALHGAVYHSKRGLIQQAPLACHAPAGVGNRASSLTLSRQSSTVWVGNTPSRTELATGVGRA